MRRLATAVALAVALVLPAVPAGAAPYDADPHRLVPFRDTVQQVYTSGTDRWEVWVCEVADGNVALDESTVTARLNEVIVPYFQWLSGGRYSPTFVVGGRVTSEDVVARNLTAPEAIFAPGCETAVSQASESSPNGVLVVVDAGFDDGYATAGAVCPEDPFSGCQTTYPANARRAVVAAATVTAVAPSTEPRWITVAHEIGHALNWTHSYGGQTTDPDTGLISRYDNPMDVMSGGIHTGLPVGAIAYHRYAAGWIQPSQVRVHDAGTRIYDVSAIGAGGGVEMVAVRTDDPARFYVLGARRRTSYDSSLPKAGIEVYEVDQRREVACSMPSSWPSSWPCFATLTRVAQTPAVPGLNGTAHVLGIDEEAIVGGFAIRVVSASTSGFSVRVAERDSGTFVDDDGNFHEADIEQIAGLGLTNGCNPPANDRYCPERSVSRAEMAAFLVRALGEEDAIPSYRGYFPDVPRGQWYTGYVERLFELGITVGNPDGTYRPGAAVSRAEMAAFLIRAFGPSTVPAATGVFADVDRSAWFAGAAEELLEMGITTGCATDPLRYCPADAVRRDQMASFLVRSLEAVQPS